ncbi:uncharacterized protein TRIREDRAFT_110534 [Trichoderma reesei QM6a]|uniref:Predicted protein n=1 Tax=Hypocrea jecorina (strain QM6a) TaxID=431241 RepID=G0RS92_HYPJQ|nr:uncharacterized protein TRIREDRAFT_110534 [Trichoderma reesei QM6a]EGR46110.1 predicted protein [Trichoderma reesei QM6a]
MSSVDGCYNAVRQSLPATSPGTRAWKSDENTLFSPLALYFRGDEFPTEKKGEKTMIGENGWLECTDQSDPNKNKQTPQKKTGILDGIRKIAKDMSRRTLPASKVSVGTHAAVSLDPREQSLLYCELEFNLTTALNMYISEELDKGHLSPDHLKRVSDEWHQKGRHKVVGFRYDLETQLELVSLHINDFSFYGRRQGNTTKIALLLNEMKTNARNMRVRTFCQPDTTVAKHLVDSQSLFNLINASASQQIALAEIARFFKLLIKS